jgi:hypothetical protein
MPSPRRSQKHRGFRRSHRNTSAPTNGGPEGAMFFGSTRLVHERMDGSDADA